MDSKAYISILKDNLIGFLAHNPGYLFQQDNASCHVSQITREWQQSMNIPVLKWPSRSPDLSPIENLWSIVKRKMESRRHIAQSKQELFEMFQDEWLKVQPKVRSNLVKSMPSRMAECVKNRGGPTKY